MPSLVKIGPVVLEKKMKMYKVYDNANDDDNNDDHDNDRKRTNSDQKSSLETSSELKNKTNNNLIDIDVRMKFIS